MTPPLSAAPKAVPPTFPTCDLWMRKHASRSSRAFPPFPLVTPLVMCKVGAFHWVGAVMYVWTGLCRPTHGFDVTPPQWRCCQNGACTDASPHRKLVSAHAHCPHLMWPNAGLFKTAHWPIGRACLVMITDQLLLVKNSSQQMVDLFRINMVILSRQP